MKNLSLISLMLLLAVSCKKEAMEQDTLPTDSSSFHGVNWADARDNFVDGPLVLSGFDLGSDRNYIQQRSQIVISGFKNNLQANTVRIPVNPQTVLDAWWQNYNATIEVALNNNMRVILACWEGSLHRDGFIDDTIQFYAMWDKLISEYKNNSKVYFEVMNEPYGYSADQWKTICKQWLQHYPDVPRARILIGGSGYCQFVNAVASDSAFNGCFFSQHAYAFWFPSVNTVENWKNLADFVVNPYQSRTILTEFGVAMTTGIDYSQPANGDGRIAFLQAMSQYCDSFHMGSCYWPGLRDGDSYSLQILQNDSMLTTNATGADLIMQGWGIK